MLSSILPGIRHVRTPLVTGAMYVVAAWLLLGSDGIGFSPRHGTSTAEKRVDTLIGSLSPSVVLASASLGAILLGSLLLVSRNPWGHNGRWPRSSSVGSEMLYSWAYEALQRFAVLTYRDIDTSAMLPESFRSQVRYAWENRYGSQDTYDDEGNKIATNYSKYEDNLDTSVDPDLLNDPVRELVQGEADVLTTRLRVERESLFDEIDRLRSEAELRYSILAPTVVVIVALAWTWSPWALLALLLPVAFARQGWRTEKRSDELVWVALQHGVVQSPLLESLDQLRDKAQVLPYRPAEVTSRPQIRNP